MSLPIVYALRGLDNKHSQSRLLNILQQRKANNGVSWELRKLARDEIIASGALEHTKRVVLELLEKVEDELTKCELEAGSKNWILRLMQKRLKI
jgi:ophiobolin F synthase